MSLSRERVDFFLAREREKVMRVLLRELSFFFFWREMSFLLREIFFLRESFSVDLSWESWRYFFRLRWSGFSLGWVCFSWESWDCSFPWDSGVSFLRRLFFSFVRDESWVFRFWQREGVAFSLFLGSFFQSWGLSCFSSERVWFFWSKKFWGFFVFWEKELRCLCERVASFFFMREFSFFLVWHTIEGKSHVESCKSNETTGNTWPKRQWLRCRSRRRSKASEIMLWNARSNKKKLTVETWRRMHVGQHVSSSNRRRNPKKHTIVCQQYDKLGGVFDGCSSSSNTWVFLHGSS